MGALFYFLSSIDDRRDISDVLADTDCRDTSGR